MKINVPKRAFLMILYNYTLVIVIFTIRKMFLVWLSMLYNYLIYTIFREKFILE